MMKDTEAKLGTATSGGAEEPKKKKSKSSEKAIHKKAEEYKAQQENKIKEGER